ncbi:MAG: site-specific DNA-methyltransferase [Acidobacteriota bacterium]
MRDDAMKKLAGGDEATRSLDIVRENLVKLEALFPEVVSEDGVNVDTLNQLIGKTVNDAEEKYGLNWKGKRRSRQIALTLSTGTLLPCPEDSVDWDTTKNIFIEGDNLEVLKLLQKSYAGKVKLIYMDPPYNTGNDFVYADNFQDNIKNYLELTGQLDEGGRKLTSNTEASGRFHTDWLNMMYPRLKLARGLLKEDGLIWISIDDGESQNLKLLLCEVFGEENFLAQITWQRAYSPVNLKTTFSENHDFLLCFAKSVGQLGPIGLARSDEANARYTNPDNDPRGLWKSSDLSVGPAVEANIYPIKAPSGREVLPPSGYSWRLSRDRFDEFVRDNRISFGPKGSGVPRIKRFISEVKDRMTPLTVWPREEVGDSQEATRELKDLFDDNAVFVYPKPTRLLRRIIEIGTASDDVVLDCFAGSGTTAHAVIAQNAADGGTRRYILVQLPERLDPENKDQKTVSDYCDLLGRPRTIAEVTKERLRRAGNKVKAETPMFAGDTGFRVFKLASSNIRAWEPEPEGLEQTLLDAIDHLKANRTEMDVVYELLLKLGLDLCVPIESRTIVGKRVHAIGGGVLLACLTETISREDVEPLAQGIVDWRIAIAPAGETTCIFRDSAFADDVAKANLAAIFEQNGLGNLRSL